MHEVLPLSVCNPLGSLEADKGPHAPVLATINLCSDDLTHQLHTPRCAVPRLALSQDPLQSLLETAVWGSSPTAEVPTHNLPLWIPYRVTGTVKVWALPGCSCATSRLPSF